MWEYSARKILSKSKAAASVGLRKRLAVCLHIFLNDCGAKNVTKISIHSYRMTLFGATVVARRAGTKFATNATNNRTAAVAEKARRSAVPTP